MHRASTSPPPYGPPLILARLYRLTLSSPEERRTSQPLDKWKTQESVASPSEHDFALAQLGSSTSTILSPLEEITQLEQRVDRAFQEVTSLENVRSMLRNVCPIVDRMPTPASPSDVFPVVVQIATNVLAKTTGLLRMTDGTTLPATETTTTAVVDVASCLTKHMPWRATTIVDPLENLFEMDVIDLFSVDVSPKQQLMYLKAEQRDMHQSLRSSGLSIIDVVAIELTWWDHTATYRVFSWYQIHPTESLYDDVQVVKETHALKAWQLELWNSRTIIPNLIPLRGKLYIGIQIIDRSSPQPFAPLPDDDYSLRSSVIRCLSWTFESEKWQNKDCRAVVDIHASTEETLRCNCNFTEQKFAVAGSVQLSPNFIEFDNLFGQNKSFGDFIVLATVITEWALYLLVAIILVVDMQRLREIISGRSNAWHKIKKQLPKMSVLPPDRMPAPYMYKVMVTTGSMFGAGTSARVGFQIFGSGGKTTIKMLNPEGESLVRGGSYGFVMPLRESLGDLKLVHIWHDNEGGGDQAAWFLGTFTVQDMQTDEMYMYRSGPVAKPVPVLVPIPIYLLRLALRGDFQVEKVLHVATDEDMTSFSSVFREATDAMFYDQHLWTSPLIAPQGSDFSKCERLSCCWAIFNAMMLSSAMWYRDDNDVPVEQNAYDLGFLRFTLQEVYVSVMTAFTVIPVTLVPVQLFRMQLSDTSGSTKSGAEIAGRRRWPKYVAWVIVVSASIISSFFVILYGIEWGREKSMEWLKAFFLSFVLSSSLTETGQVLVLAVLAALICSTSPGKRLQKVRIQKKELQQALWSMKVPEKVYPPGEALTQRTKTMNEQRRKVWPVLKNLGLLFLLVTVLFYIRYTDREPFAFHASQTLSSAIMQEFDSVTTIDSFWMWTSNYLLPVMYPSAWYNGWKMKHLDKQFPSYTKAFRIGPTRLSQVRVSPGQVEIYHFVDLTSALWWDDAFKTVLGLTVFTSTLALLRVLRFSKTISSLLALPGVMKNDLLGFTVYATVFLMAFSCSGSVVFGTHMKAYSDMYHTVLALFDMTLGRFFAEKILESNRYVGPVYFTVFMISIFIVLINFLMTIICDAIAVGAYREHDHDQELVDYLWKSLKAKFGVYSAPEETATNGEVKLIKLKANLQMIQEALDETLDVAASIRSADTTAASRREMYDSKKLDSSHNTSSLRNRADIAPIPPCIPGRSGLNTEADQEARAFSNDGSFDTRTESSNLEDLTGRAQAQRLLEGHNEDIARVEEVQHEGRRRANDSLMRKLALRRMKRQLQSSEGMETVVECAQEVMEQHAAHQARLEQQQHVRRLAYKEKLREKIENRRARKQKDDDK
ncbi:PKD1L3 [Branchiostoma lanceolatum]|uniref:PKD1L3 protein n=1 Tax=Branchiostoma lanceolatum TaxID=7740 RepID=A0A8K0EGL2_BRALA|nr:PKD1L3 [Branchiostoma lanceolatum]